MRYLIIFIVFFLTSLNAIALEQRANDSSVQIDCLKSSKKHHLGRARSKNFPQSRVKDNYYNCLEQSKKIVKVKETSTPSSKVNTGAAVLLNPVGAAYWLLDKIVNTGVDKTINK